MTITLAISNQKGGVAKTTSCFSIAACLAEKGHRTLVVDLDPQAHLTMAAGYDADELDHNVVDLLLQDQVNLDWEKYILATPMENLQLLAGDLRLAHIERELNELDNYEYKLSQVLGPLKQGSFGKKGREGLGDYDYILLDCPPSLGTLTILALTASDWALVPVQAEYFASRGLLRLLDVIEAVKQHTNPALDFAIFVTMYDSRNRISQLVLAELKQHFEGRVLATPIRIDTRLRESPMSGEPVILYAPRTRASQEYRSLTSELLEFIQSKEHEK
ncbi:MAG: ParA family protein [Anaerolineales bacterium]